jgi:hypothetical protein
MKQIDDETDRRQPIRRLTESWYRAKLGSRALTHSP